MDEISEWFDIAPAQVRAVIDFATRSLDVAPQARLMRVLFDRGTPAPLVSKFA